MTIDANALLTAVRNDHDCPDEVREVAVSVAKGFIRLFDSENPRHDSPNLYAYLIGWVEFTPDDQLVVMRDAVRCILAHQRADLFGEPVEVWS